MGEKLSLGPGALQISLQPHERVSSPTPTILQRLQLVLSSETPFAGPPHSQASGPWTCFPPKSSFCRALRCLPEIAVSEASRSPFFVYPFKLTATTRRYSLAIPFTTWAGLAPFLTRDIIIVSLYVLSSISKTCVCHVVSIQ